MECTLYLAEGCNLQCNYCYEGIQKNNRKLDLETAKQAIEYIVKNNDSGEKIYLTFLGGEPLLNFEAIQFIISYIQEQHSTIADSFQYSITTNGLLLNDTIILLLKKYKIRTSVSIDGDYATQQLNRKGITHEKYMRLLDHLKKIIDYGIPYTARLTLTSNNASYLYQNIQFLFQEGIKSLNIGIDYFSSWDSSDLTKLNDELEKMDAFYLQHETDDSFRINLYDDKIIPHITDRKPCYCNAGTKSHITITCDGDIFPCTYVAPKSEWKLGNIREGVKMETLWSQIKSSVKNPSPCSACDIAAWCIGARCGFMNYSLSGHLNHPIPVECEIEQMLFKHQQYIISELNKLHSKRILDILSIAKEYRIKLSDFGEKLLV